MSFLNKASKFHTEAVNEKVKAKFLAYLIKEYGKNREFILNSSAKKHHKSSRKRSISKPLSSKKQSPESYMINIVHSSQPQGEKRKRKGSNASSDRNISRTSNSMPRMKMSTTAKKLKKKKTQKISENKNLRNDNYLYQSPGDIKEEPNFNSHEDNIALRKVSRMKNRKKPVKKKQHAIDSDSELNHSTVMTHGWGVTRDKPQFNNSSINDSMHENPHLVNLNTRRLDRITQRLYNNTKPKRKDNPIPIAPAKKIIKKKKQQQEWIGNPNSVSVGSQGSSEDGVWVSNF